MKIKYINLLISVSIILGFNIFAFSADTAGGFVSAMKRYTRILRLDDESPIRSFIIKKRKFFEKTAYEQTAEKTPAPAKPDLETSEEERRRGKIARADYLLKQGDKQYRKKKYDEAFELYKEAFRMMD
jgi:hypothetical protein